MTTETNRDRVWKRVALTLGAIGVAGWLWAGYIEDQYALKLSREPDPATGSVYPLNWHNITVYQTRDQRNWLYEIRFSSFALFVAGAVITAFHTKDYGVTFQRSGSL